MSMELLPVPTTSEQVAEWTVQVLQDRLPPDWVAAVREGDDAAVQRFRAASGAMESWPEVLRGSGLSTPDWPRDLGGLGVDAEDARTITALLRRYGAHRPQPDIIGLGLVAPTLLAWADADQKARLLPPLARGDEQWCQLFSEPGAGSDLAALTCRARPLPEGGWSITGQKVWSSFAHQARYGLLLARTDDSLPKHRGLSLFVIEIDQPGIDVRPLRQVTGDDEFNEVYLDDAVVRAGDLIGPLNAGWRVALSTLAAERSSLSSASHVGPGHSDDLVRRAQRTGAWDDPVLRDRLVRLVVEERVHQMNTLRIRSDASSADATASVAKLFHSELMERLSRLAPEVSERGAVAWGAGSAAEESARQFLSAKYFTIPGGTSEVQRNIIAERVLGMPRTLDPRKGMPFRAPTGSELATAGHGDE